MLEKERERARTREIESKRIYVFNDGFLNKRTFSLFSLSCTHADTHEHIYTNTHTRARSFPLSFSYPLPPSLFLSSSFSPCYCPLLSLSREVQCCNSGEGIFTGDDFSLSIFYSSLYSSELTYIYIYHRKSKRSESARLLLRPRCVVMECSSHVTCPSAVAALCI